MGERRTVMVTGYAQAPQGTAMYERYRHVGVVFEIDLESGEIVDAEITVVTNLARDFFRRVVVGHNLRNGLDELLADMKSRYCVPSITACIMAIRGAHERFAQRTEKTPTPPPQTSPV